MEGQRSEVRRDSLTETDSDEVHDRRILWLFFCAEVDGAWAEQHALQLFENTLLRKTTQSLDCWLDSTGLNYGQARGVSKSTRGLPASFSLGKRGSFSWSKSIRMARYSLPTNVEIKNKWSNTSTSTISEISVTFILSHRSINRDMMLWNIATFCHNYNPTELAEGMSYYTRESTALEELLVSQQVKKFFPLFGNWRFIFVFTCPHPKPNKCSPRPPITFL